jgi:hypothetical protein
MRDSVRPSEYALPLPQKCQKTCEWSIGAFVTQSYADIHRKLQKLEGFTGMNATQLLEVANKVFVNQENEEKTEADKE